MNLWDGGKGEGGRNPRAEGLKRVVVTVTWRGSSSVIAYERHKACTTLGQDPCCDLLRPAAQTGCSSLYWCCNSVTSPLGAAESAATWVSPTPVLEYVIYHALVSILPEQSIAYEGNTRLPVGGPTTHSAKD